MAQRRMFSKTITSSSRFLMMPQSAQSLYFHLGMNADDDGFCEHFMVMRMTESKPDDLRILQAKGFVQVFDDRVLVILDWKENNYIQKDRYSKSKYLEIYKEELKILAEQSQKNKVDTECIQDVSKTDTQVRLGKVRKGKDRLEKEERGAVAEATDTPSEEMRLFVDNPEKQQEIHAWLVAKGVPEKIASRELAKFLSYWIERNKSGTKMRWQLQPTFELKRRIATWFNRLSERQHQNNEPKGIRL